MKKILTVLLLLIMVISISIPAMAAEAAIRKTE